MHAPRASLRRDTRVFISAVSREFGTLRQLVKQALEESGYHAIEQTTFPLDYRDVIEKLRNLLASCDAVIHIVGHCFGAAPPQQPEGTPRQSYTQLEYTLACALGKPVYVFLTDEAFPSDPHEGEAPDHIQLQAAYRHALTQTGQDYWLARSREEIDQKVRSLPLQVERLTEELIRTDDRIDATGRRLGRWSALLLVLVLIVLGTLSALVWQGAQQRQQAQTVAQVIQGFADRLLDELLTDKSLSIEEVRRRALAKLPATVDVSAGVIQQLLEGKIAARVQDPSLSPLARAQAALAVGQYEAVFAESAKQRVESRELAMLEGTAALAQFRAEPQPTWQTKALEAFRRARELSNATTQPLVWADATIRVAAVLNDLARYAEAEPLLKEALQLLESQRDPSPSLVALALNNLAELYRTQGRYAEAEPYYQRALAIREQALGPQHPDVAQSLHNLAALYWTQGRYAEAELYGQRALAVREQALGPQHPNVAFSLSNLAGLYLAQGRYAEAEPYYQRALAIQEQALGPQHPNVAISLNGIAVLYSTQGRYTEAEPYYQRALAVQEQALGPQHPDVAISLSNLAGLYRTQDRYAEAEPYYQRALTLREQALGPQHPNVAFSLHNLALLLQNTNRLSTAEPLMRRAVRVLRVVTRQTGYTHPHLDTFTRNYTALLQKLGRSAEEIQAALEALKAEP